MSKLDLPLEVLVPCHDTAAWRRQKAEQYPGDDRNLKAAEALDTLGAQLEALEESPLHDRLHDFYLNNPEFNFNEHVSATLRGGFSLPASGGANISRRVNCVVGGSRIVRSRGGGGVGSYVLDLWAEHWRRREATGDMIIVRYADDFIVGFQREADARRFWDDMRKRFEEFSLSLNPDKTRLTEFGNLQLPRLYQFQLPEERTEIQSDLHYKSTETPNAVKT